MSDAVLTADLVDGDHVRVRDPRHRLPLAEHAHPLLLGRRGRAQDLERDVTIELRIVRAIDDPHPALSELAGHDESPDPRAVRKISLGLDAHLDVAPRIFFSSVKNASISDGFV